MQKLTLILLISFLCYGCIKKTDLNETIPKSNTAQADTLFTYKFYPNGYLPNAYLVATDSAGNIISEIKTQKGIYTYKLFTPQPYNHPRINIYEIDIPTDPTASNLIIGYLQIKKGGIYDSTAPMFDTGNFPLNIHFKNATTFDNLLVSTDLQYKSIFNIADTVDYKYIDYSDNSKVYVQVKKNNKVLYNFFDIARGTHDFTIDLNQCNKTPLSKFLTSPGDNLSLSISGKSNKNSEQNYQLGSSSTPGNTLTYYYPSETFEQYISSVNYVIYDKRYTIKSTGPTIVSQVDKFDATFKVTGSSMADYKTTTSGSYSYYAAQFNGRLVSNNISVYLYSPLPTPNVSYKLPDFSKYLNKSLLDPTQLVLQTFGLYQVDGFNDGVFPYPNPNSVTDGNIKAVEGR